MSGGVFCGCSLFDVRVCTLPGEVESLLLKGITLLSLLNCSIHVVVTILQNVHQAKRQHCRYCPRSFVTPCQTKMLLHFTTMIKLSKGPLLSCCHVNMASLKC